MYAFAFVAGGMAVIHLVAGWERPRLAVFVSAVLWLLYAYYEHLIASGVLCEKDCNIRVDLVFFIPILVLATFCAYQSYMGRQGQAQLIGAVLGVVGLLVFGLVAEGFGYGGPVVIVIMLGVLAFTVYRFKLKARSNPKTNQP